jgi:hypothetical protein
MEQNLPELGPLIVGTIAFLVGVVFALRERAGRKAERPANERFSAA